MKFDKKKLLAIAVSALLVTAITVGITVATVMPEYFIVYFEIYAILCLCIARITNRELEFIQKNYKLHKLGGVSIGDTLADFMHAMLIIAILPALLDAFSPLIGGFGEFQAILDLFSTLLPMLVLLDLFTGFAGAVGGKFGKVFEDIIGIYCMLMIIEQMGNIFGTTMLGSFSTVFESILPLLVLFSLMDTFFKKR